jgi:hypothetical protein
VLARPYDELAPEVSDKFFQRTPAWAERMPGVAFMS